MTLRTIDRTASPSSRPGESAVDLRPHYLATLSRSELALWPPEAVYLLPPAQRWTWNLVRGEKGAAMKHEDMRTTPRFSMTRAKGRKAAA